MKELKIKIWNIKNVVLMEVLEQDESLRGKEFFYRATNGLRIESWCYPQFFSDGIYIKGEHRNSDNIVCCRTFAFTHEAEEYVEKVKEAVAEFNKSIKEEILDKEEKEYIRNVIKPFRNEVEYIRKNGDGEEEKEFIEIKLKHDYIDLPFFEVGIMYQKMEQGKKYTLEELEV